jgi:predicted aminopeptidase
MSAPPLSETLHSTKIPPEDREKLALVPTVKKFGVQHLGLKGSRNYEHFVKLDREFTTLVLTAAQPDSLDVFRWTFPIVGAVPYIGFFDRAKATNERDRMKADGYDVYLRSASAFSTLGWFQDPILSPMLAMDEVDLANTVLHEMTHATIYFANHTEFNETAATFVGNQASLMYLAARYGAYSSQVTAAIHEFEDQRRFSLFIRQTIDGLREVYKQHDSRQGRLTAKVAYLEQAKQRFREEVLTQMHNPQYYERFPNSEWNNASLLARDAYYGDLELFAKLFAKRGESLRDFIRYLQTWESDPDPRLRLQRESGVLPG